MGILEDHHLPFPVKRIFWIDQVPDNTWRGNHAHKSSEQLLICMKGNIKVELENIEGSYFHYHIDHESEALYLPARCWGKFLFTSNALALCFASDRFDESDYIRSYPEFEKLKYGYHE